MDKSAYPYRTQLLAAVQAFLEGTPEAMARGKTLYATCPRSPDYSIGDGIWGVIISELSDTIFQESPEYLRATQQFLEGRALLPRFGAECYNFLPLLTPTERTCYDALLELALALHDFPGEASESEQASYTTRIERTRDAAHAALDTLPLVLPADQETTYRFALRQVGALLPPMHMQRSFIAKRLTWGHSYGELIAFSPDSFLGRQKAVDATEVVMWALHMLSAVAGKDTMWQTWDIRDGAVWFATF